jgi:hypothetical protein
LAAADNNSEAKIEYGTLGAVGLIVFVTKYFNLIPGKMHPVNEKIESAEPGPEREAQAYNSLKKLADDDRSVKSLAPPLAILLGALALVNSNSYVSGVKYVWLGLGATAAGLGLYHLFTPIPKTRAEMEFEAVEAELKKGEL